MPKEGERLHGGTGGGLEDVKGAEKWENIQSFRPSWANAYEYKPVTGVPESSFKFYESEKMDVQSGRPAITAIAMIFVAIYPIEVKASPDICYPDDLMAHSDAILRGLTPDKNQSDWSHPCRDVQCRAARDLSCAYDAQSRRDWPNSMGRGDPRS